MARAQSNEIAVRLAHTHSIYKEQGVGPDGRAYDIHITGFHPDDGQVAVTEPDDGSVAETLTPVYNVPRTPGVLAAINEGRLIDVRDSNEAERINDEVEAAYQRRLEASPPATPTETVTLPRAEYDRLTGGTPPELTGDSRNTMRPRQRRTSALAGATDDGSGDTAAAE